MAKVIKIVAYLDDGTTYFYEGRDAEKLAGFTDDVAELLERHPGKLERKKGTWEMEKTRKRRSA